MSAPGRVAVAMALLVSALAQAHPRGFHKRVQAVVHPDKVEVLVRMDLDGSPKAQWLRTSADANKDGLLDAAEAQVLKAELVDLVLRPLQLSLSGYVLRLQLVEAKVGLREDRRTSDTGVSFAALFESTLPQPVFRGMELIIEDEAPDASHVRVEAEQEVEEDGGTPPHAEAELQPGDRLSLKLLGAM